MILINKAVVVPELPGWLLIDLNNGSQKFVNIKPHMKGILEQLKDQNLFNEVYVDELLKTVTWPGELDLDPDNLYEEGIDIEEIKSLFELIESTSV